MSAQPSCTAQESRLGDFQNNEENHKGNDQANNEPKKTISYEIVKPIHMNSFMDKRYQLQRSMKSPLDQILTLKPKPQPLQNEKEEFESINFDSKTTMHLDRGFRTSLGKSLFFPPSINLAGFAKPITSNTAKSGLLIETDEAKDINRPLTRDYMNMIPNRAEQPKQEQGYSMEKSESKGRSKLGGALSHMSVVKAHVMPIYGEDTPVGAAPLKKERKLPIAFETYKKMLNLRKRVNFLYRISYLFPKGRGN